MITSGLRLTMSLWNVATARSIPRTSSTVCSKTTRQPTMIPEHPTEVKATLL